MDVDGTMTDGGVSLLSQTEEIALEIKTFDAHDGQGLTLAHTAGLRTGCITGRQSSALLRRAHETNMESYEMKQPLKMPAYEEILQKTGGPTLLSLISAMIFRIFPLCAGLASPSRGQRGSGG
jgi:3-deoxy-D-manno-octulosonate 8-phosphate phosphatase (KDO 8-P phosphatase)